jgi:hypothetical protein
MASKINDIETLSINSGAFIYILEYQGDEISVDSDMGGVYAQGLQVVRDERTRGNPGWK